MALPLLSLPHLTISSPSESLRFRVGDVVSFSGSATDAEDHELPASQLSWTLVLHHCLGGVCHTHPYSTSKGESGTFSIADHGDEIFFELTLNAVSSTGLTGSTTRLIRPQTVQLTLESSPPGRQVIIDGTSGPAPLTRTVIAGSSHTLRAPQSSDVFQSWSDSGAQQHSITAGTTDATYTARFSTSLGEAPALAH
jgi:hypothetical protein